MIDKSNFHLCIQNTLFARAAVIAFEGKLNPRVVLFESP
jgi:hypothetical protein